MEHSVKRRTWKLGSRFLWEKDTWSSLGKTWHVDKESSIFLSNAAASARETYFALTSIGARFGGINPSISTDLWKLVGIPKLLYGSEIWQLNNYQFTLLEKVQDIIIRIMQGLLPEISGSTALGLLDLVSIEVEID